MREITIGLNTYRIKCEAAYTGKERGINKPAVRLLLTVHKKGKKMWMPQDWSKWKDTIAADCIALFIKKLINGDKL